MFGVQRCERPVVFVVPRSPRGHYFGAMMQANSFLYLRRGKIAGRRHELTSPSTRQNGPSSVSFPLLVVTVSVTKLILHFNAFSLNWQNKKMTE